MSKKPPSRYSQFRARQRGEALKAGDSLTASCDFGSGTTAKLHGPEPVVRIQNRSTGKYLTSAGAWKKGGTE